MLVLQQLSILLVLLVLLIDKPNLIPHERKFAFYPSVIYFFAISVLEFFFDLFT